MWDPSETQPSLSDEWIGETRFTILRQKAKPGYEWHDGRETRIQNTTRPPSIWPEIWNNMSLKQRQKATQKWKDEGPRRDRIRKDRGIKEFVPDHEVPALKRDCENQARRQQADKIQDETQRKNTRQCTSMRPCHTWNICRNGSS